MILILGALFFVLMVAGLLVKHQRRHFPATSWIMGVLLLIFAASMFAGANSKLMSLETRVSLCLAILDLTILTDLIDRLCGRPKR